MSFSPPPIHPFVFLFIFGYSLSYRMDVFSALDRFLIQHAPDFLVDMFKFCRNQVNVVIMVVMEMLAWFLTSYMPNCSHILFPCQKYFRNGKSASCRILQLKQKIISPPVVGNGMLLKCTLTRRKFLR